MLHLSSVEEDRNAQYSVSIDGYLPLSFRSHDDLIGPKAVRYGNQENSLVEFDIDPVANALRDITLVCFENTHTPQPFKSSVHHRIGFPVLTISNNARWDGPEYAQFVDVGLNFSVGAGPDFVELDLGSIAAADLCVRSGPAEYYFQGDRFAGVRITGLSREEVGTVLSLRMEPKRTAP